MSKTLVVDKPCYDTSDTFESHVEDDNDTALDRAVNQFRSKEKDSARAELAQLRSTAASAEELQRTVYSLRRQVALLDDYSETIRQHEITITAQAAQLEQAYFVMNSIKSSALTRLSMFDLEQLNTWLAANAPAPQEERTA